MKKIKTILAAGCAAVMSCLMLSGCNQAEIARQNLTKEADNFNSYRCITVINCVQGDVLFQMKGKCSITADTMDNQLEIIVDQGDGIYRKHIVGLSDNVTYVVEDITENNADNYNYELNFNPDLRLPYTTTTID